MTDLWSLELEIIRLLEIITDRYYTLVSLIPYSIASIPSTHIFKMTQSFTLLTTNDLKILIF